MSVTPTTAQLELLAELEMARMPVAVIANRLGDGELQQPPRLAQILLIH
jgi:hypothetical protein